MLTNLLMQMKSFLGLTFKKQEIVPWVLLSQHNPLGSLATLESVGLPGNPVIPWITWQPCDPLGYLATLESLGSRESWDY